MIRFGAVLWIVTALAAATFRFEAFAQSPEPSAKPSPRPAPIARPQTYADGRSCGERCNVTFATCGGGNSDFERCWDERDKCLDVCRNRRFGYPPLIAD